MDVPSCSHTPDGEGEEQLMPRHRPVRRRDKTTCFRCNTQRSIIVSRSVAYCRECFERNISPRLYRVLHPALTAHSKNQGQDKIKLKGNQDPIESSKRPIKGKGVVPSGVHQRPRTQPGNLLLALSGGAGSTAMMDILKRQEYYALPGQARKDKRKGEKEPVWMKAWGVYVDFSRVIEELKKKNNNESQSGSRSRIGVKTDGTTEVERLREMAVNMGIEFVCLKAEDVFDPSLKTRLSMLGRGMQEGGGSDKELLPLGTSLRVNLADPTLPLSSSTSTHSPSDTDPAKASTPLDSLLALLLSVPPPSRPSILAQILETLLHITANCLPRISHLLVGETSTREAARVISATAAGRGWSVPLELDASRIIRIGADIEGLDNTAEQEEERINVVKVKPMKDISIKEAAFWCHLAKLETVNHRSWDVGPKDRRGARGSTAGSIEALTEQFIATLNTSHPSTVSTINKTGDKLVFAGSQGKDVELCPFCQMPVDSSALLWKSSTSLTSLTTKTTPSTDNSVYVNPIETSRTATTELLATMLCYSCLTTFTPLTVSAKDALSSVPIELPFWVRERVQERQRQQLSLQERGGGEKEHEMFQSKEMERETMGKVVKEFLIPQDDE